MAMIRVEPVRSRSGPTGSMAGRARSPGATAPPGHPVAECPARGLRLPRGRRPADAVRGRDAPGPPRPDVPASDPPLDHRGIDERAGQPDRPAARRTLPLPHRDFRSTCRRSSVAARPRGRWRRPTAHRPRPARGLPRGSGTCPPVTAPPVAGSIGSGAGAPVSRSPRLRLARPAGARAYNRRRAREPRPFPGPDARGVRRSASRRPNPFPGAVRASAVAASLAAGLVAMVAVAVRGPAAATRPHAATLTRAMVLGRALRTVAAARGRGFGCLRRFAAALKLPRETGTSRRRERRPSGRRHGPRPRCPSAASRPVWTWSPAAERWPGAATSTPRSDLTLPRCSPRPPPAAPRRTSGSTCRRSATRPGRRRGQHEGRRADGAHRGPRRQRSTRSSRRRRSAAAGPTRATVTIQSHATRPRLARRPDRGRDPCRRRRATSPRSDCSRATRPPWRWSSCGRTPRRWSTSTRSSRPAPRSGSKAAWWSPRGGRHRPSATARRIARTLDADPPVAGIIVQMPLPTRHRPSRS